ncbi:hypothetical protein [Brevibacterium antiquum]|uniref:hypothetical protein n=1 Tax=Brevibacterium antiquum TaxID=234835 RepID=UPI001E65ACB0|nr:hypothetical protein [Brevibacterium antiquum]
MKLIEQYRRIRFERDGALIQKLGCDHHHRARFLPFWVEYLASSQALPMMTHVLFFGRGDRALVPSKYLNLVRGDAVMIGTMTLRLLGLRHRS